MNSASSRKILIDSMNESIYCDRNWLELPEKNVKCPNFRVVFPLFALTLVMTTFYRIISPNKQIYAATQQ